MPSGARYEYADIRLPTIRVNFEQPAWRNLRDLVALAPIKITVRHGGSQYLTRRRYLFVLDRIIPAFRGDCSETEGLNFDHWSNFNPSVPFSTFWNDGAVTCR